MQLSAEPYLAELYQQIAFLGAVLGGFAVTFLGTLLATAPPKPVAQWALGATALAAVSFVALAIAATLVGLDAVRLGAADIAELPAAAQRGRFITAASFYVGVYALLVSIGLSGWTRSRTAGWITSAVALLGGLAVTLAIARPL